MPARRPSCVVSQAVRVNRKAVQTGAARNRPPRCLGGRLGNWVELFSRCGMNCCSFSHRRWSWFVVGALVLLAVVHRPLLRWAAAPCVVHRPIEACDHVIFFGDTNSYHRSAQYDAAAELWRSRKDLKIVVLDGQSPVPVQLGVMPASGEFIRRQLIDRGVAASAVEIVSEQFRDERTAAQWLGKELAKNPSLRVMLVVDEYQSGRVARLIDAVLPSEIAARVGLWPLPPSKADRGDWFRSRDGVKRLVNGWQGLLAAALADDCAPDDLWEADRLMQALERRIAAVSPTAKSGQPP